MEDTIRRKLLEANHGHNSRSCHRAWLDSFPKWSTVLDSCFIYLRQHVCENEVHWRLIWLKTVPI